MLPVAILTPEPSCVMVVSAPVPDTGLLFHPFNVPISKSVLEIVSAKATVGAPKKRIANIIYLIF
jgi:hypothetical protein